MAKNIRFVGFPEIKKVEKQKAQDEKTDTRTKEERLRARGWSEETIQAYLKEMGIPYVGLKARDAVEDTKLSILRQKLLKYDIKLEDIQGTYSAEIAALDTIQDIAGLVKLIAYNLGKI